MSHAMEELHRATLAAVREIDDQLVANGCKSSSWHLMISYTGGWNYGKTGRPVKGTYTLNLMDGNGNNVELAHPEQLVEEILRRRRLVRDQEQRVASDLAELVQLEPVPPKDIPF